MMCSGSANGSIHYFKFAADHGYAHAQVNYGNYLQNGKGISIDMRSGAHYFKLAADQERAEAECHYALCLFAGVGLQRDLASAIQYFKLSAAKGSTSGQSVVA
jgi:TPR repeat protein